LLVSVIKGLKITINKKKKEKATEAQMLELLNHPHVQSWRAIMNAHQKIYRFLETELLKNNCSIPRFQIFFYLYFHGPISSIELAQLMHVTRGNVSTFITRLVADKLVYLVTTQERGGKKLIHLSNKGKEQFESFFPEHIQRVIKIAPELSQSAINKLNQIQV